MTLLYAGAVQLSELILLLPASRGTKGVSLKANCQMQVHVDFTCEA